MQQKRAIIIGGDPQAVQLPMISHYVGLKLL